MPPKYGFIHVPEEKRGQRGGAVRSQTHQIKMDALFKGKTFDVVGRINLPKGQTFVTPLGVLAQHGWTIRCIETGELYSIGYKVYAQLRRHYKNLTIPPKSNKGGRPKGSKNKTTVEGILQQATLADLFGPSDS